MGRCVIQFRVNSQSIGWLIGYRAGFDIKYMRRMLSIFQELLRLRILPSLCVLNSIPSSKCVVRITFCDVN